MRNTKIMEGLLQLFVPIHQQTQVQASENIAMKRLLKNETKQHFKATRALGNFRLQAMEEKYEMEQNAEEMHEEMTAMRDEQARWQEDLQQREQALLQRKAAKQLKLRFHDVDSW